MTYAYVRSGIVDHISESSDEYMSGVDAVVKIPDGESVVIGDLYNKDTGFSNQVESVNYKSIDVPGFLLLFTYQERIKARELRATDEIINDFWLILDDPRTLNVNLSLASVQLAIEHTLTQINANGVSIDVQLRKSQILDCVIQ